MCPLLKSVCAGRDTREDAPKWSAPARCPAGLPHYPTTPAASQTTQPRALQAARQAWGTSRLGTGSTRPAALPSPVAPEPWPSADATHQLLGEGEHREVEGQPHGQPGIRLGVAHQVEQRGGRLKLGCRRAAPGSRAASRGGGQCFFDLFISKGVPARSPLAHADESCGPCPSPTTTAPATAAAARHTQQHPPGMSAGLISARGCLSRLRLSVPSV